MSLVLHIINCEYVVFMIRGQVQKNCISRPSMYEIVAEV